MTEIIKIAGLEEVRQAFIDVPKHLRKKVMLSVLRKAAQPILRAAKSAAPVAKKSTNRVIPGLIKKTLGITRSKLRKAANGEFGVFITARVPGQVKRVRKIARKSGSKGPNFGDPFYHRFQEAGFSVGKASRLIPGKKYLGSAFEAHKNSAVNIIKADLVKETVAAFEKRARK